MNTFEEHWAVVTKARPDIGNNQAMRAIAESAWIGASKAPLDTDCVVIPASWLDAVNSASSVLGIVASSGNRGAKLAYEQLEPVRQAMLDAQLI